MNVETYKEIQRSRREEEMRRGRVLCPVCLQPPFGCYCASLRRFDPKIEFVVLIHPLEARRRIATGRMSHLCMRGSRLIRGEDFSDNAQVNAIARDPNRQAVVLYPGPRSLDLSALDRGARASLFPAGKPLAVFVLDGTWWTARKMIRSSCLASLPRVCFTPRAPSRFRVRKQPSPECWSTIEAIHETIELLGESQGFAVEERAHDALLEAFDGMVERQLRCVHKIRARRHAKPVAASLEPPQSRCQSAPSLEAVAAPRWL